MANAQTRGWGDPDSPGYRKDHIVNVKAAGVVVPVHKAVAPIFEDLLWQISKTYDLDGYGDDWGYANRDIRGRPGVKSNHSWGLAVDLNATENPLTKDPNARRQFKKDVVDPILRRYKGLVEWGGDYRGERKDYMHFEFTGTPSEARALVRSLSARKAATMAKLDKEDLDNIEAIIVKHLRTVLGSGDSSKDSPTHVSLADLQRDIRALKR